MEVLQQMQPSWQGGKLLSLALLWTASTGYPWKANPVKLSIL